MAAQEVTAKLGKEDNAPTATVMFDFGDNLDEASELFDEETVHSLYVQAAKINLQAHMRSLLAAGKTADQINEATTRWRPGVRATGKTPMEKIQSLLNKLSEEEREELFRQHAA